MAAFGRMPTQPAVFTLLFVFFCVCFTTASKISDLRKCANKACTETISRATVMARYPASSPLHLSLNRGEIIEVKSKSAGNKPELWGGVVNGKFGYFPKAFVREFDMIIDNPLFDVPTEDDTWTKQAQASGKPETEQKQPPPPPEKDQPPPETPPPAETKPEISPPPVDETEIDETDLSDDSDLENIITNDIVQEDEISEEKTEGSPDVDITEILSETEKTTQDDKTAEGDKTQAAEGEEEKGEEVKKDPLLADIAHLQKMLVKMNDNRPDTKAFNDFLSKQFGGDADGSKAEDSTDSTEKTEDIEGPAAQDVVDDGSDFVFDETDFDETDIDDTGAEPTLAATLDKEFGAFEPTTDKVAKSEPAKTEEKDNQREYISGVRVLEDDDDEDVEKNDDEPDLVVPEEVNIKLDEKEKQEEKAKIDEKEIRSSEEKQTEKTEDKTVQETVPEPKEVDSKKIDGGRIETEDEDGKVVHGGNAVETQSYTDKSAQKADSLPDDVEIEDDKPADEVDLKFKPEEKLQPGAPAASVAHGTEDDTAADDGSKQDTVKVDAFTGSTKTEKDADDERTALEKEDLLFRSEMKDGGEVEDESEILEREDESEVLEDEEEEVDAFVEVEGEEGDVLTETQYQPKVNLETSTNLSEDKAKPAEDEEVAGKKEDLPKMNLETLKNMAENLEKDVVKHAEEESKETKPLDPKLSTDETPKRTSKDTATESGNGNKNANGMGQKVDVASDKLGSSTGETGQPEQEEVKEKETEKDIKPDSVVPGTPTQAKHQPVDIDFKAGQPTDIKLESSESGVHQQSTAQTPALQSTPSLATTAQALTDTVTPVSTKGAQTAVEGEEDTLITEIGGTRFYIINGEIADIVPDSAAGQQEQNTASAGQVEPELSQPPTQATLAESIQPTATTELPEMSAQEEPSSSNTEVHHHDHAVKNDTDETADESPPNAHYHPHLHEDAVVSEHYETNADFLNRKTLSVNSQAANQMPAPPKAEDGKEPGSTKAPETVAPEQPAASDIPASDAKFQADMTSTSAPPASSDTGTAASVVVEDEEDIEEQIHNIPFTTGEEETAEEAHVDTEDGKQGDVPQSQTEKAEEKGSVTPPTMEWDGVPPPPTHESNTPSSEPVIEEEPTVEGDPFQMDDYFSRKINDEDLLKNEEEAASSKSSFMGSLEARCKAIIDKLPPSLQSLLEQEPLGLSPAMTILVTMTALTLFISITCASCLCSSGGKQTGTKDALAVVRELEQKLLIAVKEKENLEDQVQERQAENKALKAEFADIQSKSGSDKNDLQNVSLHNEVLKKQTASLQEEIAELKEQLSRNSDAVKSKDKKSKDVEKEVKKLQDSKTKLEKDLHKRDNELQRLGEENEDLKSAIQSLTDQVQLLDTSKLQLLAEADDWKEKVDELKERLDHLEQENRQMQETISFKDNELEVMKDCYVQLKSFEKGEGEGDEKGEEDIVTEHPEDLQEKIQAMMDVSKVNATLRAVQEEKDSLDNKLKIEHGARKELEEQLECLRRETESSMSDKMKAERQCQEAQTKLSVLTAYFKDKEVQLQRELGEHEALKKQNLSKLDNADENTRSLQKELELNKQQVESLKRELAASERDFRSQIAANEKKAHENWLNARAAERELKEIRHEAAVLRQKLTEVERRHMEPGLIRPLPTRGMPPGMLNGPPPPPGMERSPSRGSLPPGAIPPGPPHQPFRDGEFASLTPRERERLPPSHPARHMPHPPPEARSPPPRMMHPASPPRMMHPDARSPPPYDRRGPPHPMDSRTPPVRMPPSDMGPPPHMRGPLPPHMGGPPLPPMGSPGPRDSPRDPRSPAHPQGGSPYGRPPSGNDSRRHQSQV